MAYLKFVGQTLALNFSGMPFTSFICFFGGLVSIEIMLSWIQTLSALSSFSIFANICNIVAIAMVVKEDVRVLWGSRSDAGETRVCRPPLQGCRLGLGWLCFALKGLVWH